MAATGIGEGDPAQTPATLDTFPDPRTLLRAYGLRPRKGLGQHFLTDRSVLSRIVAAADLCSEDVVLEIGPGLGLLTAALASAAARVVAVEVDPALQTVLRALFATQGKVQVVAADILREDPGQLAGLGADQSGRVPGYKVVANLPYHITSAALRHILEASARPELAVLMVQREVGERILARPGTMSVLTVAVQVYAAPKLVTRVAATAFHPPPKVESVVLRLDVHTHPAVDAADMHWFFQVVRSGFGQRRKQLRNSLTHGLGLPSAATTAALAGAGIDPQRRAETLDLDEWLALSQALGAIRAGGPGLS